MPTKPRRVTLWILTDPECVKALLLMIAAVVYAVAFLTASSAIDRRIIEANRARIMDNERMAVLPRGHFIENDCDALCGPGWSTRDGRLEEAKARAANVWNTRAPDTADRLAIAERVRERCEGIAVAIHFDATFVGTELDSSEKELTGPCEGAETAARHIVKAIRSLDLTELVK